MKKFKVSKMDKTKVWYLASPYSHKNSDIMEKRYAEVSDVAAQLILAGLILIEPIAMCHHKSLKYQLPTGYEYWKTRDRTFIERSDGVIVLLIPGWKESVGVTDEIAYAKSLGKPVLGVKSDNVEVLIEL